MTSYQQGKILFEEEKTRHMEAISVLSSYLGGGGISMESSLFVDKNKEVHDVVATERR